MELSTILALFSAAQVRGTLPTAITGLSYNSKTTEMGELFFCLRGNRTDGHIFAPEAVKRGAAALIVEEFLDIAVPQVKVPDARQALALVSRHFYGNPAGRLGLVGVTGTNGKTTTTFYIREILRHLGAPVGIIGTVMTQLAGPPEPSAMTTPESADLAQLFSRAVDDGCDWLVMEVSSHALAMGRVNPADFDISVVLNITRDHFEFHGCFEHYHASKAKLVREMLAERKSNRPKAAILNADDPMVMQVAEGAQVPVVTFSTRGAAADVRATDLLLTAAGSIFTLHLPGATPTLVRLPMPGEYNVANALAAAATGWLAGVTLAGIVAGLEACRMVPGRAEAIDEGQPFHVLVDFAHNPDALSKVVSLRPSAQGGRTILVFGAEGGKDPGKRPLMGEAARGADYVIITSDNTYQEEPMAVAQQVQQGLGDSPHEIHVDRRDAIERALTMAAPGDLVIIAGKGHERTWVYGGQKIAFDDREFAREILRRHKQPV